jgi:phospholipid-binding lipoprotein MlaA
MTRRRLVVAAAVVCTGLGLAHAADDRARPLPGARAVGEPAPAAASGASLEYDPWQRCNRKIFAFNDKLDQWVLEPTAKGWDYVMPAPVQRGVGNFFANLRFPVNLVNNLLQGKGVEGAKTLGRFTVNTLLGAAGFLDPASDLGLRPEEEDFGQTLGVWGVPAGPYLVLPVLGPSSLRDGPALAVDSMTAITPFFIDGFILAGAQLIDVINTRARYLDAISDARAASLDYYTFVRNAWVQRRQAEVEDRAELPVPERTPTYEDSELYTVP